MAKFINLTGKRFGKLLVLKRINNRLLKSGQSKSQYQALCDCGNVTEITGQGLVYNKYPSCPSCRKRGGIPKGTKYGRTRHGFIDRRVIL